MNTRALPLAWTLAAVLTMVAAAACAGGPNTGGETTLDGASAAARGSDHSLGSPQAPVLLVEYVDFQ